MMCMDWSMHKGAIQQTKCIVLSKRRGRGEEGVALEHRHY